MDIFGRNLLIISTCQLKLLRNTEEKTEKNKLNYKVLIFTERQYKDYRAHRTLLSCKLATRCVGVSCGPGNMYKYITGNLSDQISSDLLQSPLLVVVAAVLVAVAVVRRRSVLVSGQLVGHRGLVSLPPGWVYHDNLTLTGLRVLQRSSVCT